MAEEDKSVTLDPMTLRLVEALESSARVNAEVVGQVKGLEREFTALRDSNEREFKALRETFDRQLGELEDEMKSMNSHLDNLVRETVVTNGLLREDMEDRKTALALRQKVEEEEREWRRKMEIRRLDRTEEVENDNRNTVKKYMEEAWLVFKQPFGYLIAGVIFWVLINWFQVPPSMVPQAPTPPQVEESP
jgi:methyl coenzyme M reductase subunit C-like uncharacterized protein (methanogenesis marker protein 7)